jgi:hypothetical protein
MRQTFRDALNDPKLSRRTLIPLVLRDLAQSLAKEHFSMLRDTFGRPALIFNAFVLGGLATVLALALNVIPQQVLRLGANDPQIALADDLVAKLEQGIAPTDAVSPASIDIARSLTPFVIAYDNQGHPLVSKARLDGAIPAPPSGVFDYVRQHGQDRLSWQPVRGTVRSVRIAAVVERVSPVGGAPGGFVLAGRNMREVESREHLVGQLAMLAWLAMLGLIVVATATFGWLTRPRSLSSMAKAG